MQREGSLRVEAARTGGTGPEGSSSDAGPCTHWSLENQISPPGLCALVCVMGMRGWNEKFPIKPAVPGQFNVVYILVFASRKDGTPVPAAPRGEPLGKLKVSWHL